MEYSDLTMLTLVRPLPRSCCIFLGCNGLSFLYFHSFLHPSFPTSHLRLVVSLTSHQPAYHEVAEVLSFCFCFFSSKNIFYAPGNQTNVVYYGTELVYSNYTSGRNQNRQGHSLASGSQQKQKRNRSRIFCQWRIPFNLFFCYPRLAYRPGSSLLLLLLPAFFGVIRKVKTRRHKGQYLC